MTPAFPGVKLLQLKHVHKNIGGTDSSPTTVNSVRVKIPPDRITGPNPLVYARAASSGSWEAVDSAAVSNNGVIHNFTTPGSEVWLRVAKSGGTISARNAAGKIVNAITVEVVS